ncbi:unnamed protein product [Tetraodon nigroviridis]|uniref:Chromosome undetermined SCAF14113, whole genome shotgun sequence n=1 Tax=Tetraodon nigroviridis TaxID=99883 RepID=Q4STU6_TETNG|nr:unnamed protein product [Tetraodon nigroviridis]
MAVLYLDVVDYRSILARASEFHLNFSGVFQGLSKDGGDGVSAESLEEVLDILAEEGSDWISGFFAFLFEERGEAAEGGVTSDPGEVQEAEPQPGSGSPVDQEPGGGEEGRASRPRRPPSSALREELRVIHQKMEAKRIAGVALEEIKAALEEEEAERELVWVEKMKTLEAAWEQLRREKQKLEERVEKERAEKERAEKEWAEKERAEKERAERVERWREERAEKERRRERRRRERRRRGWRGRGWRRRGRRRRERRGRG